MYRLLVRSWPRGDYPYLDRYMRIDRRSVKSAYDLARLFDPRTAEVIVQEKRMLRDKKFHWLEVPEETWREEVEECED
jgi:hypothetical protein